MGKKIKKDFEHKFLDTFTDLAGTGIKNVLPYKLSTEEASFPAQM